MGVSGPYCYELPLTAVELTMDKEAAWTSLRPLGLNPGLSIRHAGFLGVACEGWSLDGGSQNLPAS